MTGRVLGIKITVEALQNNSNPTALQLEPQIKAN